jgi:ABC-type transport system involved in multi-copper enzyme maturation permease subunit
MTAVAVPARRERPAARAVPWTRLAWVTWRQHRAALAGAAAFLGAIAVYLAYMGHHIHQAYDALVAAGCPQADTINPGTGVPFASAACQSLNQAFLSFYGTTDGPVGASGLNAQTVPFMLLAAPVLLGAFTGAPVLARELESGTFRFAWTQGAGRLRLAAARLIPLAILLTAAAYGLSALFSWYFTPFFGFGNTDGYPMQLFGNLGVNFAAWALFSFTLAGFLGVLLRRAVAATAVSLAVTTVLDVVTMMALRQHLVTPATVTGAGPTGVGDCVLGHWFTNPSGAQVSANTVDNLFAQAQGGHVGLLPQAVTTWAAQNHYAQWWSYQPATRWWQLQLTEGAWLLVASLLLITATILLIRRRPA